MTTAGPILPTANTFWHKPTNTTPTLLPVNLARPNTPVGDIAQVLLDQEAHDAWENQPQDPTRENHRNMWHNPQMWEENNIIEAWVTYIKDEPAGVCILRTSPWHNGVDIPIVYTTPTHRNTGAATTLLTTAITRARHLVQWYQIGINLPLNPQHALGPDRANHHLQFTRLLTKLGMEPTHHSPTLGHQLWVSHQTPHRP